MTIVIVLHAGACWRTARCRRSSASGEASARAFARLTGADAVRGEAA